MSIRKKIITVAIMDVILLTSGIFIYLTLGFHWALLFVLVGYLLGSIYTANVSQEIRYYKSLKDHSEYVGDSQCVLGLCDGSGVLYTVAYGPQDCECGLEKEDELPKPRMRQALDDVFGVKRND